MKQLVIEHLSELVLKVNKGYEVFKPILWTEFILEHSVTHTQSCIEHDTKLLKNTTIWLSWHLFDIQASTLPENWKDNEKKIIMDNSKSASIKGY